MTLEKVVSVVSVVSKQSAVLGLQPVHHPGKQRSFPDVLQPADPRYGALEPEPESGVRERPVLPQLQVPVLGVERQPLVLDARDQLVVIIFAL